MGWRENATLGQLMFFYRATLTAEISTAEIDEILDVASIEFDTRDEARQFVDAMKAAQLANDTSDGMVEIVGNAEQIKERCGYLRKKKRAASKGGKKRALSASRREDGTFVPATSQPPTSQDASDDPAPPGIPVPVPVPIPSLSSRESFEHQPPALAHEPRHPPPPLSTNPVILARQLVPAKDAAEVFEIYQSEREIRRQIGRVLMPNGIDLDNARTLHQLCNGDLKLVRLVIRAFLSVEGAKGYWKTHRWAMRLLIEPDNFETCRGLAGEAGMKKQAAKPAMV